jgi:serine/threonine protein phosphatase PrpC
VVDKSLEFLILASDGLWDVVTNKVPTETFFVRLEIFLYPVAI